MEIEMPRFIALCGFPQAGKTEVQAIISRVFGFQAIDDSEPLRDAAKLLYNLTDWHVRTQEGKASLIKVGERMITVRKALGDLGDYFEAQDPHHFPRLAVARALERSPNGRFVFGSVRKTQPWFFRNLDDALVVEVRRDGCVAENSFDRYDADAVEATIQNHLDPDRREASLHELEATVRKILDPFLLADDQFA